MSVQRFLSAMKAIDAGTVADESVASTLVKLGDLGEWRKDQTMRKFHALMVQACCASRPDRKATSLSMGLMRGQESDLDWTEAFIKVLEDSEPYENSATVTEAQKVMRTRMRTILHNKIASHIGEHPELEQRYRAVKTMK
jgi:hypothetical protein